MSTNIAQLSIHFLDWWHAGTGHSGGSDADMICQRDQFGCPAIPMSQIKGTLRETAERFWSADKVVRYFGEATNGGDPAQPAVDHAQSGAFYFPELMTIDPAEAAWFAQNPDERGQLFGLLYSTAIDDATGTAKARSLRQVEAAVPMTLTAKIQLREGISLTDWVGALQNLCALTPAFGKLKNDGYGRAIACCEAVSA